MKKKLFLVMTVLALCAALSFGQETIKGMSLNGSTGLIATPTAQIGWERSADIGLDFGYDFVHGKRDNYQAQPGSYNTHIPKVAVSLFKKAEIAVAYDSMNQLKNPATDPYSILVNGKFQFYKEGSSAVAVGGNLQFLRDIPTSINGDNYTAGQLYVAATYSGQFFNWPAATTLVVGKTFANKKLYLGSGGGHNGTQDIDLSMGFELSLLPQYLKNYVQWINDFSNYSYSAGFTPAGSFPLYRGSFNTGVRIDPMKGSQYKFVIDAIATDVLDKGDRAFVLGICFGMAIK